VQRLQRCRFDVLAPFGIDPVELLLALDLDELVVVEIDRQRVVVEPGRAKLGLRRALLDLGDVIARRGVRRSESPPNNCTRSSNGWNRWK